MSVKTRGLKHLHLRVRDVERSARFYGAVAGMVQNGDKYDGRMVFLVTPGADDLLTVSEGVIGSDVDRGPGRIGDNGGIDHFGIVLANQNDVGHAVDLVLANGGSLIERRDLAPGYPTAFVRDPDGYAFQL